METITLLENAKLELPSLGVTFVTLKRCVYTDYQPLIFTDSNFRIGK